MQADKNASGCVEKNQYPLLYKQKKFVLNQMQTVLLGF